MLSWSVYCRSKFIVPVKVPVELRKVKTFASLIVGQLRPFGGISWQTSCDMEEFYRDGDTDEADSVSVGLFCDI